MKTAHRQMLEEIRNEARLTASYTGRPRFSEAVMQAMAEVDRVDFLPPDLRAYAYDNNAQPIECGQTISQPYIVALMTDLLDLQPEDVVLEVGTGSGYQAAILARLASRVYSIEVIPELAESARQRLARQGCDNVETRCADGAQGWPERAPFDAIIVTAAATHIPETLVDQLKPGGRMVIPVGLPYMHQELFLVTKDSEGATQSRPMLGVIFVPLVTAERPPATH